MPGDRVRISVVQEKNTYIIGRIQEILQPSTERVEPRCELFTRCGGCDWQQVPYAVQLAAKIEQLRETLKRIGGLDEITIQPIIESSEAYNYRDRIQGQIQRGKFHYQRRRSNESIEVNQCEIASKEINRFLAQSTDKAGTRINAKSGEQEKNLASTPDGRVEIAETENGIEILPINEVNSTDLGFRQVNPEIRMKLTELIIKTIDKGQSEIVHDLYCGRGDWAIANARRHPHLHITGVDSSSDNISIARMNAATEKLCNVQFKQAKVEKVITRMPIQNNVCIVDPPRAGLDSSVTTALCNNRVSELLYISCHPATLARDLKQLVASGYEIMKIQPLDMFPQTAHLECFVHLQNRA